ncbi:MAG: leucyl/phenylalanyl-tRNA--protein transferase, partial [Methyloligellaceae bacterium]
KAKFQPGEALPDKLRRWVLGAAWSLKPPRTWGVPATLWMVASHYAGLRDIEEGVPDPDNALTYPDGLAGICHDMGVESLMAGYRVGLFLLSHIGPQKWWAPSKRMVLALQNFHMEKNLRRRLRKKNFMVTFDSAFEDVVRGCAEPRRGRTKLTWITPDVIAAYAELHRTGHAHSVEVWDGEGNLAGGAYGVAAGQVFFTESQFSRQRDASKAGFATLNCHLQKWGFVLNDGKFHTGHLAQAGFELMPRGKFNALLARHCAAEGRQGPWTVDDTLDVANWDPKAGPEQFHNQAG